MVDWTGLDYAKELTRPNGEPIYQCIVTFLRRLITEGQLREGDSLPTERELARLAGLSRGTVSLAYDQLKRDGILRATPGRGSHIATDRYVSDVSRKEQAIRVLSNALERMEGLGFTPREMEAFLHLLLLAREGREIRVRAALLDCNPEALGMLGRQLQSISHLELEPFLLEELPKLGAAELATFDLILTTESHTPQVLNHLARHPFPPERLLSVAVSPTRETLITLARLPEDARITVCTETARFAEIITQHLSDLGHSGVQRTLPGAEGEMAASTRRIVPPPAPGLPRLEDANTIFFDYQIDRGSLLRVEEAVTTLLLAKGERVMGGR